MAVNPVVIPMNRGDCEDNNFEIYNLAPGGGELLQHSIGQNSAPKVVRWWQSLFMCEICFDYSYGILRCLILKIRSKEIRKPSPRHGLNIWKQTIDITISLGEVY